MTAYGVIKKYGWTRYTYGDRVSGFCIMGSVYEAYGRGAIVDRIRDKIKAVIRGRQPAPWNDAKCRTKAQVLAVLRKARV